MPANYVLLERIELNASAASVTFSNIPQSGYTDLKIVTSTRGTLSGSGGFYELRFNGLTTNLSGKYIQGNGSAVNSDVYQPWAAVNDSGTTANTFSSTDIYIPNYSLTTNYKSISIENVREGNATTGQNILEAGLWSSTAAITSIQIVISAGSFAANSTFSLYGLAAVGTTPATAPKAEGGNSFFSNGTYWYHVFTSSGTFRTNSALTCDYLVVAGGGAGGVSGGGGGGAGGLRSTVTATGGGGSLESAITLLSGTSYTVTVGSGGAGGGYGNSTNGSNSSIAGTGLTTITSIGGGIGASYILPSTTGGSGGGGSAHNVSPGNTGSAGTANQGRYGGNAANGGAGGGGGAGVAAGNAGSLVSTAGGAGVAISAFATATSTGSSSYYAGGGGGGGWYNSTTSGASGGSGGGGAGGNGGGSTGFAGVSGVANTGGGGGGGGGGSTVDGNSGSGGSGIVIIRYAV